MREIKSTIPDNFRQNIDVKFKSIDRKTTTNRRYIDRRHVFPEALRSKGRPTSLKFS